MDHYLWHKWSDPARFGGLFYAPATLLSNPDRARYERAVERTGRRCAAIAED